ncbi:MAG: SRPBCC family protein [Anaerolineaceae bacterium]|nr:SRPBCC family protein [Anaerolineaceae bacterium]
MTLQVEHAFTVSTPIDEVWAYFADPPQVVPCLPGAELLEIINETTYRGAVGLRVGPIAAQFHGKAEILEIDTDQHTMRLRVGGDQQGAPGRAEAEILFSLSPVDDSQSEIKIVADVGISGKLAQVGGGMIQSVSKFMFNQFAKCISKALEKPE